MSEDPFAVLNEVIGSLGDKDKEERMLEKINWDFKITPYKIGDYTILISDKSTLIGYRQGEVSMHWGEIKVKDIKTGKEKIYFGLNVSHSEIKRTGNTIKIDGQTITITGDEVIFTPVVPPLVVPDGTVEKKKIKLDVESIESFYNNIGIKVSGKRAVMMKKFYDNYSKKNKELKELVSLLVGKSSTDFENLMQANQ